MRSEDDILSLIADLDRHSKAVKEKMEQNYWQDENIPRDMLRENRYKTIALEWVLGKHPRFD